MEWHTILIPAVTGAFAFFGALAGNRVEISWIKKELVRHELEHARLHRRISKIRLGPSD